MLIFNAYKVYDETSIKMWPDYPLQLKRLEGDDLAVFRSDAIATRRFNNVCFKAIKTNLLQHAYRYPREVGAKVRLEEDYLMQLPYFDSVHSVYCIPDILYCYRMNPGSVTRRFAPDRLDGIELIDREIRKYGEKWNVSNLYSICDARLLRSIYSAVAEAGCAEKNDDLYSYLKRLSDSGQFRMAYKRTNSESFYVKIILRLLYSRRFLLLKSFIRLRWRLKKR